jgi:hypothetical protein
MVIVNGAEPLIDPEVAVMTAAPFDFAVSSPLFEIVASGVLETLQVAELVRFCVLPSL